MLDNALIALILDTIIAQESIAGIAGTPIAQAFQPTMQGINTQPTAYFYKIGDRRVGFPYRADVWDLGSGLLVHTELQQYETTFQFSALSTQDPANPSQYTASDILNLIAYCLQSATAVATLEAQGVGILRVTDVRNPYFADDRQQFEASPNFDAVFTHKQIIASTSPIAQSVIIQVLPVPDFIDFQLTNWDDGGNWDSGENWDDAPQEVVWDGGENWDNGGNWDN